ncbi:hypothetical protein PSQ90_01815 [Devosia rhodophyticola]|uniref:Uncharacterized protein n=1 Tax=Devosia rhodophyticola TaxID=3026423 RepID=A0ABY7YYS2_9HYPH|nr:hypothetical protein [Devosia rhodophyticola]WDR06223.1 hypothetical protein PSQ90_01815 [Devosia rhodophyticola]
MPQAIDHANVGEIQRAHDRLKGLDQSSSEAIARIPDYCALALDGLKRMRLGNGHFPQTMRNITRSNGSGTRAEGDNLRYATIVAQGLGWLPERSQRSVLEGITAAELALICVQRAAHSNDVGVVALAAWAAAETAGVFAKGLFDRLEKMLASVSIETVPVAWTLTATLAARHLGNVENLQKVATRRLMDAQGPKGLFGHVTPLSSARWHRAHLGCFADQVYPIQALARLGQADGNSEALQAANDCAARIVHLQGTAGQWWWHYDVRDGSVTEGFPVYSVHQHAMAPMALLDLHEAGGTDYRAAVIKGLEWIDNPYEARDPLVSLEDGMIWRKVGRTEPPKFVRSISALSTSVKTGWHLPGLDAIFPPGKIDYECRPYEFGWMLYAWHAGGVVKRLA